MQKRSSKSESTQKTEQDRSCWKFFTMVKVNGQRLVKVNSQRLACANVVMWRHLRAYVVVRGTKQVRGAHGRVWTGAWGAWQRVRDSGDAWSACSWGRNFRRRVGVGVMLFLALFGWVLLGIGCSVALCLYFGKWMSRTMISESCRDCGRDGGDSLLTVTTGWRQGQWKNVGDVHRNQ